MQEFLKQLMGKQIDISCGAGATVRGDVVDVKDGILYLRDEHERVAYVAVDKVAIVWECKDSLTRPGFVV
ncbi:MAG: MM0924 family protein [Pyrinomonadaceae bacterium]